MSGRIICLALAAALTALPASAAQQSRAGASRHVPHSMAHHRHVRHRDGLHRHMQRSHRSRHHHALDRRVPALAAIADPVEVFGLPFVDRGWAPDAIANPWPLFDPSWKLCQLDPSLDGRPDLCGPYSYYPFGPYGYRPYGTYRPYADRAAPGNPIVPSARVIRIERED